VPGHGDGGDGDLLVGVGNDVALQVAHQDLSLEPASEEDFGFGCLFRPDGQRRRGRVVECRYRNEVRQLDAIRSWQGTTVVDSGIEQLIGAGRSAVVLERWAFGGGATDWYFVGDSERLAATTAELRPGSVVSFYLDDRISYRRYTEEDEATLLSFIARDGDALVGWLMEDGWHIDMRVVSGPIELREVVSESPQDAALFFGAFPGRDNDGVDAITVTMPDVDGIVRPHPH
jgi:hypothetical protein